MTYMKHTITAYFLFLFLTLPGFIHSVMAQDSSSNILLEKVGKPFAEYFDTYLMVMDSLMDKDSISRAELVHLFKEAAETDDTGEWELNYKIMKKHVRFYESRNGSYSPSTFYKAEDFIEDLLLLAEQAEEKGFKFIKIRTLFDVAEVYRIFLRDYEHAFNYYLKIESEVENISSKELPIRFFIYREIANLYYRFREYKEAILYFRKILDDPYVLQNYNKRYYEAMNGLGLCYRYEYSDYDRSDSCFNKIIEMAELVEADFGVWEGIAKGEIGFNYFLRGDLDTALSWLIPAVEKITRFEDFRFLSSRAMNIADIYLKKKNLANAKKYIDIALDYHALTLLPDKESHYYDILTKYYSYTGDVQKAILYHDSTKLASKRETDNFGGLILRRVEQQLRASDNNLNEQKLKTEKIKSTTYKLIAIIVSIALVIILISLGSTYLFIRRMRNAYRELVLHNQKWAGLNHAEKERDELHESDFDMPTNKNISTYENENITETESFVHEGNYKIILEDIENLMSEKKLYKNANLTLDNLANETGYNRYYVSIAINRYLNKNFSTYVNEYRVKEAIRLISNPDFMEMKFEEISIASGFSDRTSLHRAFRKITGLSPGSFRNNIIR